MDTNRDTSTGDVSRSDAGTPTGRLSSSPAEQTNQGYVPPELRPTGQSYSGAGEPTRQWSGPPPPPQNPPYPPNPYSAPPPPPPPPPQSYARGRDWRDGRNRRAPLLGPFLLITAGVVFLLNNLNVLPWSIWNQLWRLWPLILILVGLEILLGRRSPALSFILILVVLAAGVGFVYANGGLRDTGNATQTSLNVPSGGASKADVRIQMGAGELNVDGSDVSAGQLASGNLGYFENQSKPKQSTSVSSGTVQLTLMQGDSNGSPWSFFGPHNGTLTWDVHLSPEVPMKLRVETGAGNGDLDLEKLKITDLTVKRGAGNVTLTLPSSGSTTGTIDGGVGNLDLVVPEGVAARLKVNTGIGNIDVDNSFTRQGDNTYQSPNYSSDTKNRVDLTLDAGIGNVNVTTK